MKFFDNFDLRWSDDKNNFLLNERGVSFELIAMAIKDKRILKVIKNPSSNFDNQMIVIIAINNYAYIVPFVVNEEKKEIFLKTAFPSRKATKLYNLR
jgi:uncharacterized DUF497 family protein